MTIEDKTILIAQFCGWKFSKIEGDFQYASVSPDGNESYVKNYGDISHLPKYFDSVDCMMTAEAKLTKKQMDEYGLVLIHITVPNEENIPDWDLFDEYGWFGLLKATAAQRAEAFGKITKLWE